MLDNVYLKYNRNYHLKTQFLKFTYIKKNFFLNFLFFYKKPKIDFFRKMILAQQNKNLEDYDKSYFLEKMEDD